MLWKLNVGFFNFLFHIGFTNIEDVSMINFTRFIGFFSEDTPTSVSGGGIAVFVLAFSFLFLFQYYITQAMPALYVSNLSFFGLIERFISVSTMLAPLFCVPPQV